MVQRNKKKHDLVFPDVRDERPERESGLHLRGKGARKVEEAPLRRVEKGFGVGRKSAALGYSNSMRGWISKLIHFFQKLGNNESVSGKVIKGEMKRQSQRPIDNYDII